MRLSPSLRFVLSFVFIAISAMAWCQKIPKGLHDPKDFKKNFVAISESVYACKYETCNLDYLLFLRSVKRRMNPAIYQSLLPDTTKWSDKGMNNVNYTQNYLHHPSYYYFPLVNVSYEQANFYCVWLTQQYNNNPKRKFKKVVFKIPTRSEWENAAGISNDKNSFPWGQALPKAKQANYYDSSKAALDSNLQTKQNSVNYDAFQEKGLPYFTHKVNDKKAKQNKLGMYHIAGNVSEMVSGKGECAGGNFQSNVDWLRIEAPNEFYPGYIPCPLIGFRIFMQVMEE